MKEKQYIFPKIFSTAMLGSLVFTVVSTAVYAEDITLDKMVIIGAEEDARQLPGSGALVSSQQMEVEATSDINQVLKTVPGVYIREEEGSGLRPNIGIRGATAERSEKITLLEDGVMIAPAPYSNPAAYYFPTALRMDSVEVLKGAPLLRYGPQTTGGVLNMISTPIPEKSAGTVSVSSGSFDSSDVHAHYGSTQGEWGWLLEAVERNSLGYKSIDRSNRDSGYNISDYVGKLRWQASEGVNQSAFLKLQRSEEVSNETYLGLTDSDFDNDPNRRYGLSSIDQMVNDHTGIHFAYTRELTDAITVTLTQYHNEFSRNWYKLSGGGSLIEDANSGDTNAQGILDGLVDTTGLDYKNNNRAYESQGTEVNFGIEKDLHRLDLGARIHHDEMDRFQPVDVYDQINGSLVYQSTTAPTGSNNRLEEADALSVWVQDDWQLTEALKVNLSLRYEDVESGRVEFADADRTSVSGTKSNNSSEVLPGAAFTYTLNNNWQVLAAMHKGFSPLGGGADEQEEPETSTNLEVGTRYNQDDLFVEVIAFHSDFSDKAENCSVGSPCSDGATSGTFENGEAIISGLEMQLANQWVSGEFTIPLNLSYTYTRAEVSEDNVTNGLQDGDKLKDVPESVFSARLGLEHANGWDNYAVAKSIDGMCIEVACNRSNDPLLETDALFVVDYISRYQLQENAQVFFKVENLFDEQKIVARVPDGARPNKARNFMLGMKVDF